MRFVLLRNGDKAMTERLTDEEVRKQFDTWWRTFAFNPESGRFDVCNANNGASYEACLGLFREMVESNERLKELRKAQGWVSVKERLPKEHYRDVLIRTTRFISIGYVNSSDQWVYMHDEKFTNKAGETLEQYILSGEVTHWMPLPSPPERNE